MQVTIELVSRAYTVAGELRIIPEPTHQGQRDPVHSVKPIRHEGAIGKRYQLVTDARQRLLQACDTLPQCRLY